MEGGWGGRRGGLDGRTSGTTDSLLGRRAAQPVIGGAPTTPALALRRSRQRLQRGSTSPERCYLHAALARTAASRALVSREA